MNFSQFISEITLDLPYHETLNKKLFDLKTNKLKPNVRKILLDCAESFRIGCKIILPQMVHDIVMTGGNANFNFTKLSDIDVHIITDLSSLQKNSDLVQSFFKDEKKLWTLEHQIKVAGYPIEMYIADMDEPSPQGQGVYSLKNNEWLIQPSNLHLKLDDNPFLQKKVDHYYDLINELILQKNYEGLKVLKERIKTMRQEGLTKQGEFSFGNLTFKALRNSGILDKMDKFMNKSMDKKILKGLNS